MSILIKRQIPSHLYLKCRNYIIQLAIFYNRNEFLWIGDSINPAPKSKWFGDTIRAMNNFELEEIFDKNFNSLKIPNNLEMFIFNYGHSKFIECNHQLSLNVSNKNYNNYTQNETLDKKIRPCMNYIAEKFEFLKKRYWLAAGTLLGWYRDCGLIPYTHDADFGIMSSDLDMNLRDEFLGKKLVRTWLTLGTVANSFEIRLSGCSFTFDILVFYKRNLTTQCNSFHAKKIFSNCFPTFENICSAELFGRKFMVHNFKFNYSYLFSCYLILGPMQCSGIFKYSIWEK